MYHLPVCLSDLNEVKVFLILELFFLEETLKDGVVNDVKLAILGIQSKDVNCAVAMNQDRKTMYAIAKLGNVNARKIMPGINAMNVP